jgi:hypothetical protein
MQEVLISLETGSMEMLLELIWSREPGERVKREPRVEK